MTRDVLAAARRLVVCEPSDLQMIAKRDPDMIRDVAKAAAITTERTARLAAEARVKDLEILNEGELAEALERAFADCGQLIPMPCAGAINMLGRHMVHHLADVRREFAAVPTPKPGDSNG